MSIQINGTDIGQIIEIAGWVGSIVTMLVVGLLVYLMVRPPRHVRARRRQEPPPRALGAGEADELWALVDRMESRLEVLERALADQTGADRQHRLEPADERRDNGGSK
jgi:hypothetical protein